MQSQLACRGHSAPRTRNAAGCSNSGVRRVPVTPGVVLRSAQLQSKSGRSVRCMSTDVGSPQQATADAQKRRESMVRQGKIRNVTTKEVANLMKDGWLLLDVRPPTETEKASVDGSVQVPLFFPDPDVSPGGLIKKATAFGMGGWWLGGTHMVTNTEFMQQVEQRIPDKSTGVVVACQKGLRSLAAAEQLALAGYSDVAWINGGLDTFQPGDLPTSPDCRDLRFAGIGGLSEVLGWTEVQQQDTKKSGPPLFIKLAGLVLVGDLLLFLYEQIRFMQGGS